MLLSTPADILVPAGRPGAQVQESDLLHAGFHRAAVFMCQPLLPWRQVRSALKRRKGRAWTEGRYEGQINSLKSLEWRFSAQHTHTLTHCMYSPVQICWWSYCCFPKHSTEALQFLGGIIKMGESFVMLNIRTRHIHSCEPSVFQL